MGTWKKLSPSDTLSSVPVFTPAEDSSVQEEVAECFAIIENKAVHDIIMPEIDDEYVTVHQVLMQD